MAWFSIVLMGWGMAANTLVVEWNGGKMPVATHAGDILFVIGPAEYGVVHFPVPEQFAGRHQALTEKSALRFLSDRIPISFRFIPTHTLPKWSYVLLNRYSIAAGEDVIASIGDLLLWCGILLAIPTLLVLLVRVAIRIVMLLH